MKTTPKNDTPNAIGTRGNPRRAGSKLRAVRIADIEWEALAVVGAANNKDRSKLLRLLCGFEPATQEFVLALREEVKRAIAARDRKRK